MEKESFQCSECMRAVVRGFIIDPGDEHAFFCSGCTRTFCGECGFFDEHDEHFFCNTCWLNLTRGMINGEKYLQAAWVFKKLGKTREVEDMKELERLRRMKLRLGEKVIEVKKRDFIQKD